MSLIIALILRYLPERMRQAITGAPSPARSGDAEPADDAPPAGAGMPAGPPFRAPALGSTLPRSPVPAGGRIASWLIPAPTPRESALRRALAFVEEVQRPFISFRPDPARRRRPDAERDPVAMVREIDREAKALVTARATAILKAKGTARLPRIRARELVHDTGLGHALKLCRLLEQADVFAPSGLASEAPHREALLRALEVRGWLSPPPA
ncbi:MAG TPA: hypothetical protein VFZ91_07045 [Allosphingosinicella sp.]